MAITEPLYSQVLDKGGHVSQTWLKYFQSLRLSIAGSGVPSSRTIATTLPLTGGGNLSANRTLGLGGLTGYGTAGQLLAVNAGADGLEYVNPPSPLSAGNPTAQVGLAAVNGAAITYMRSDAAPAIDQGISPTWTGAHTFSQVAGTGTRLVTSTAAGLLGNATTIAGDYTWSGAATFSAALTASSTLAVTGAVTLAALSGSGTRYVTADASGVLGTSTGSTVLTDAVILAPAASSRNVIQGTADGVVPLSTRARASQSANIFEAQNSGGTALAWITNGGNFSVERSNAGADVQSRLVNTSTTALSSAEQYISVMAASTGDPRTVYNVSGGSQWSVGIDNSASDAFTISLGGALGTNNRLQITTAGAVTIPDLAGSGTRMVTASSTGLLSTTAIPTGTITGGASANQVAVFSGASAIGGSGSLTFDGTTLALTGAQTISSTLTLAGDAILSASSAVIRSNTADASDNKSVSLAGGGAVGSTRGASIIAYGNEYSISGGQLHLNGGGVSSGGIIMTTNGSLRYTLSNAGLHSFATAVSMSSTLSVLGDSILGGSGTPGRVLEVTGGAGEEGIRINPADGGTPILDFMDGGSTVAGEYWQVFKDASSHALTFYNGANRLSVSAAGLVSIPGAATITGTTTLSSLTGSVTRVMLSGTSGVVSASDDLTFDSGILDLTGNAFFDGTLEVTGSAIVQGTVTLNDLAGSGTRIVTAASDGTLGDDTLVSSSTTVTWTTGFTTSPTCTLYYSRVGDVVTIRLSQFTATSNATTATTAAGDAPASICPASGNVYVSAWIYNNSLPEAGFLEINSAGRLALLRGAAPSFTTSGTKGLVGTVGGGYSLAT